MPGKRSQDRQAISPQRGVADMERPARGNQDAGETDDRSKPLAPGQRLSKNGPGQQCDGQGQHVRNQGDETGRNAMGNCKGEPGQIAGHGHCAEHHLREGISPPERGTHCQGERHEHQTGDQAAPKQDQKDRSVIDRKSNADEPGAPANHQSRFKYDQDNKRRDSAPRPKRDRGNFTHLFRLPAKRVGEKTRESSHPEMHGR